MSLALILDILLAVLLVVTIVYAIVLNRRLGALRRDRSELEALAASFTEATARADASVGKLAKNANDLQTRIEQARSLADDLSFLMDRGEKTADRLENAVRAGRAKAPIDPAQAAQAGEPADTGARAAGAASRRQAARTGAAADGPEQGLRASRDDSQSSDARSEAERELLKALRSAG